MWFVDQAQITVKAGDGGRGCSALAQPPYTRYPFPDGGDGGDGGDVTLLTDPNLATLLDFHFRHEFAAQRGTHGGSNRKTGKRGQDCLIRLPVGTVIRDAEKGNILQDMSRPAEKVLIAKGGRGGLGNATAKEATDGRRGQIRQLILELKLIADVGIVGFPNAGKSSLLCRISTARPAIGAYPFTTRFPVLGVVRMDAERSFVVCDIPGLIEGAHQGRGLGIEFLRHIERTRLLIHLVDMAAVDQRDPVDAYAHINQELIAYGQGVASKPQVVVANKIDLPEAQANLGRFSQAYGHLKVWPISCVTAQGIAEMLQGLWQALSMTKPSANV